MVKGSVYHHKMMMRMMVCVCVCVCKYYEPLIYEAKVRKDEGKNDYKIFWYLIYENKKKSNKKTGRLNKSRSVGYN
jgi:hypothetical protein